MASKKRKPSAYNKHVGREMRAGKTMKQAAASWRKKSGGGSTKRPASRNVKKTTAKKRSGLSLGGFSPMGIVKAGALYIGVLFGVSRVAPQIAAYPGAVEVATGIVASTTGFPGVAFIALGAAKFVATTALRYLNGGIVNGGGGYDY
jgi:hypothetical protein